jgi:tetratricopeptide (TPR) repeat protein
MGRDGKPRPRLDYTDLWRRLEEGTPSLIESAERRRTAAEDLLAELLALPPERRPRRLEHERFRSPDLLERILDESQGAQLIDPRTAIAFAELGMTLADLLPDERCAAARARWLQGNALRLLGDFRAAEQVFAATPFFLDDESPERAFFCRAIALLRAEAHRLDEAMALLQHAAFRFNLDGRSEEEGVALLLLGLVLFETDIPVRAFAPLVRGWSSAPRSRHLTLLHRAGFALAACAAESHEMDLGRLVLSETLDLPALHPSDNEELPRYLRFMGRALRALGEHDEAMRCFESARALLLQAKRAPELALASLELGVGLAEHGCTDGIVELVRDIEALPLLPGDGRELAAEALIRFADDLCFDANPRRSADAAAAELRRRSRAAGLRVEPILFA